MLGLNEGELPSLDYCRADEQLSLDNGELLCLCAGVVLDLHVLLAVLVLSS